MLGQAGDSFRSPSRLDAYPSVLIHLYVDDVAALHERARAARAEVTELETALVFRNWRSPEAPWLSWSNPS